MFLLSGARGAEKTPEPAAGGIKGSLLIFATVIEERAALLGHLEKVLFDRSLSQGLIVVEVANELPPSAHILSTCFSIVFGDRSEAARDSRNGRKQANNRSPGGRSFSSPIDERGQPFGSGSV